MQKIINKLFPSKELRKENQLLKEANNELLKFKKEKGLKWAAYEALVGKSELIKLDNLSEEEQQNYFIGCKQLLDNSHFNRLIDDFLTQQEQHILKNVERESVLENVRSVCIALDTVKVKARQYAEQIHKEPEKFDKHAII